MNKAQVNSKIEDARRLYEQGKEEYGNGQHEKAANNFREATLIQEVALGKYHQDTIKSYWRCGRAACKAGDDREALRAYQRAVRMAESTFGSKITAKLWQDIQQAWEETHGSSDSVLEPMSEIYQLERQGDSNCKDGNFAKAIEFYQRMLEIQDSLLGEDSLDGADVRCKLACCYVRTTQLKDAETALNAALDCFLAKVGEHHPATLGAAATMKTVKSRGRGVDRNVSFKRKGWFSASLSSLGSRNSKAASVRV